MPKNIIICSDGTGNADIKDRGTNVFKMFEAIDLNGHHSTPGLCQQVAIYDDGVGTGSNVLERVLGLAFGYGLAKNVKRLYMGLVRLYEPGDQIYLFGFSRGAFTVRTLAGIITRCGVLDRNKLGGSVEMRRAVERVYGTYRQMYQTKIWLGGAKAERAAKELAHGNMSALRESDATHDAKVHFLGVWDTVDAVGGPLRTGDWFNRYIYAFKFPDDRVNSSVEHAAQALSLDDERKAFHPCVWEPRENVDQVWFAGVHANVGGGYPKQGMSLVALEWMMRKAEACGLRILPEDLKSCHDHSSVDDKLYDPREGWGVFYRWLPRNVEKLWTTATKKPLAAQPPEVHLSVFERIANGTDDYAPSSIPARIRVCVTPLPASATPAAKQAQATQASAIETGWNAKPATRAPALRRADGMLFLGRLAYKLNWSGIGMSILTTIVQLFLQDYLRRLLPWLMSAARGDTSFFVGGGAPMALILANAFAETAGSGGNAHGWISPAVIPGLLATVSFLLSWAIGSHVNRVRLEALAEFWHHKRVELRMALGHFNNATGSVEVSSATTGQTAICAQPAVASSSSTSDTPTPSGLSKSTTAGTK